ncbi:cation diffusion facilitator family transporter [Azospirillum isscasi]|uniref:Cation transporter n=1 Tax=Azospirillum isscasi TaxID=3053926 RepID=A0ABU0WM98_9PROT|nr:cation transporter [Azospirillum isscasi]MDQ2105351.1 cation transporter [Azospirillum isscasi]
MAGNCCGGSCGGGGGAGFGGPKNGRQADYRRVLRMALLVNGLMFAIALTAGFETQSMALRANALDFLANAMNYGVSLWMMGRALEGRGWASLAKGVALTVLGLWVLGSTVWSVQAGTVPDAPVTSLVALLGLGANLSVAALLFAGRRGAVKPRAVWLCARDGVLANAAVLMAAAGVWTMGQGWPDHLAAAVIAATVLSTALAALRQAVGELRAWHAPAGPTGIGNGT